MCIVFSVIEYVYWCLGFIFIEYVRYREFVCELSKIPCYLHCFVISICERDEWPSPKDSESLSFPSLRSLLMWLRFMFDLGRSPHSLFRHHFYRCLWFISFPSRLVLSLQRPISGSMLISHHHYTHHYQFILFHLSLYRYHIHVRRPQVHGSWGSLYMLHFIYEGMSFDHWVFVPSFLSFLLPYHPITLAYVTSRVLRPPWGHGIRCRLQQPLLGQVIEIWLIFRYRHASSSGSRLFDV